MKPVTPSAVERIPAELRERRQWVVWKAVWNEEKGKHEKQPFRALDSTRHASSTNTSTWATYEPDVDGIGYVFSADDPYTGVDLDQGLSAVERMAIVAALKSYTETSPSGNGVHVIVRASLNGHGRNRKGPFEVYEQGRYFTVTGDHIVGTPATIEERQAQLDEVLERFLPKPEPKLPNALDSSPVDLDDRELLDRAMSATNGAAFRDLYEGRWDHLHPSQSEADLDLCGRLAFWWNKDPAAIDRMFRSSGLYRPKWERDDYRGSTIHGGNRRRHGHLHPVRPECHPHLETLESLSFRGKRGTVRLSGRIVFTGGARRFRRATRHA
jgi:primase-polymerase (primpol)-like protein